MYYYHSNSKIYGFDDYQIINIPQEAIDGYSHDSFCVYGQYNGTYLLSDDLPVVLDNGVQRFKEKIAGHKEVLNTAKSVYVHPSCKLSRTNVSTKYSKSLNPWMADAVAIPTANPDSCTLYDKVLVFENTRYKMLFFIEIGIDFNAKDKLNDLYEGMPMKQVLTSDLDEWFTFCKTRISTLPLVLMSDLMEAELIYAGTALFIPKDCNYLLELFTGNLPKDKVVSEEDLQDSLGCENNKPTADNLISIMDMLKSQDGNTVSVGLKALSMLDYMHYANSVKYILRNSAGYWKYNKAMNSVSVKFMIDKLNTSWSKRRSRLYFNYDEEIYLEDYNLLKEVYQKAEQETEEECMNAFRYMPFIKTDGVRLLPKLKAAS